MSTEWSLDFCLVCDRQTLGGPYCSQSCRLAELDVTSSSADGVSPRTSTTGIPDSRRSSRSLSASSSQTSLSSLKGNASNPSTLSDRLQDELRDYASCFDPVRDLKRRLTTS